MGKVFVRLILLSITLGTFSFAIAGENPLEPQLQLVMDPLNGTYLIEGRAIRLHHGRSEITAAPGSATHIKTSVYGRMLHGDLDDDGDEDVAMLLSHDPGGSGTFFYVAVAVNLNGHYQGTNAMLLGDRILPLTLTIQHGLLLANYADRRLGEAMTTTPSVQTSQHMMLTNHALVALGPLDEGEQVIGGWVTIGHEVRSFQPCSRKKALWLQGDSPALDRIMRAYRQTFSNSQPYHPLFMILRGHMADPPPDGFGMDYEGAFIAQHIVPVSPDGHCRDAKILEYGTMEHEGRQPPFETNGQITFDLSILDQDGLYGEPNGKHALSYEFCISDSAEQKLEVTRIDQTLRCTAGSPGRIGCGAGTYLCLGSTHQKDFKSVLRQLAELPYVVRIDQSMFE